MKNDEPLFSEICVSKIQAKISLLRLYLLEFVASLKFRKIVISLVEISKSKFLIIFSFFFRVQIDRRQNAPRVKLIQCVNGTVIINLFVHHRLGTFWHELVVDILYEIDGV